METVGTKRKFAMDDGHYAVNDAWGQTKFPLFASSKGIVEHVLQNIENT